MTHYRLQMQLVTNSEWSCRLTDKYCNHCNKYPCNENNNCTSIILSSKQVTKQQIEEENQIRSSTVRNSLPTTSQQSVESGLELT